MKRAEKLFFHLLSLMNSSFLPTQFERELFLFRGLKNVVQSFIIDVSHECVYLRLIVNGGIVMLTTDRRLKIFEYIKRNTSATTNELAEKFNASGSTIRRDLEYLAKKNLIIRTHNGAMVNTPHAESGFLFNYNRMQEEKKLIAEKAVKFIEDYDFIALSGGTTCYMLAAEILNSPLQGITILTNSINITTLILESVKDFQVIVTGGVPKKGTYECVGEITLRTIRNFNIDKFFVGVNGISIEGGISFSDLQESEVAKEIHNHSRETYVVADHTKFGVVKPARLIDLSEINTIITDKIPRNFVDNLSKYTNLKIV
jgi:DeoR family fructose operon transcriptional repressor